MGDTAVYFNVFLLTAKHNNIRRIVCDRQMASFNSRDVRSYLREMNYQFTAPEAAFVVYWSEKPVKDKFPEMFGRGVRVIIRMKY